MERVKDETASKDDCDETGSRLYDPLDPHTLSRTRRWCITIILSFMAGLSFWAAGLYSPTIADVKAEFGISQEVALLGTALYPLGFTLGPLLGAPLSELFGRRIIFLSLIPPTILSVLGIAFAKNAAMLLVFRFLSALFISGPFAVAGGAVSDLWPPVDRTIPIIVFAAAPNIGSTLGPVIGGIVTYYVSWRWTFYIQMILLGISYALIVFFVPETYGPKLRNEKTTDPALAKQKIRTAMIRPLMLLSREPIVLAVSIYLAFVYGLIFGSFSAYPVEYQLVRGWNVRDASLTFLGMTVGILIASVAAPFFRPLYIKNARPEGRLYQGCIGAVLLPISLFWWAWSSLASVNAMVSITAGGGIGISLMFLFLSISDYIINVYTLYAASALAANGAFRTLVSTAFPLFCYPMFVGLSTQWAMTLLACISLLLMPIPFVLIRYGSKIRARGTYVQTKP